MPHHRHFGGGLHIFGIDLRYPALNPDREFVGRQLSESLAVFVKRCLEFLMMESSSEGSALTVLAHNSLTRSSKGGERTQQCITLVR